MSSFSLKVQFTGLCSFVPNDVLTKATKLMVVLPNADFPQIIGNPPPRSLDRQTLRRHKGIVRVPLINLGSTTAPADGSAIWYITSGTRIQFQTDPPTVGTTGLTIAISNKPDSFTLVAPMVDLMPSPNDIDPLAVSASPPPTVLGQILIEGGAVTTSPNKEVWIFEPSPASGRITAIAHEVTVTYASLNQASIVTSLSAGPTITTPLVPDGNNVATVRILNACDDNSLEWPSVPNPTTDVDFRWFYELLPQSSQITLLGKLTKDGLGLPTPVGAGGGVDCSPLLWGPITF